MYVMKITRYQVVFILVKIINLKQFLTENSAKNNTYFLNKHKV